MFIKWLGIKTGSQSTLPPWEPKTLYWALSLPSSTKRGYTSNTWAFGNIPDPNDSRDQAQYELGGNGKSHPKQSREFLTLSGHRRPLGEDPRNGALECQGLEKLDKLERQKQVGVGSTEKTCLVHLGVEPCREDFWPSSVSFQWLVSGLALIV